MVKIIVGGRPVQVPAHTSTSQIRLAAHVDRSKVLARSLEGRNHVVSGSIDVHEGDTFVVSRSFTKCRRQYVTPGTERAKVQSFSLKKAQEER
jgi:hypothetical protein